MTSTSVKAQIMLNGRKAYTERLKVWWCCGLWFMPKSKKFLGSNPHFLCRVLAVGVSVNGCLALY